MTYDFDAVLPGFFAEVESVLQPEEGDPPLRMARYQPTQFRRRGEPEKRELALVGLVRSGLLKRFKSSARAFELTLERMIESHDLFLQGVDRGVVLTSESLTEIAEMESDEQWEELMADGEALDAEEIDIGALRRAVRADRELLDGLRRRAASVSADRDPKLSLLVEELVSILRHAEEAGLSEQDIRNRRKVIVFSYFADTAHWIHDRLQDVLASDRRLAAYRGRLRDPPRRRGRRSQFRRRRERDSQAASGRCDVVALGGEDPRAHSGEEYRQELRKALQTRETELRAIPGGAGSGLVRGPMRGHVFCARVDDRVLLRFVPLAAPEIERDALACLHLITCEPGTARVLPDDLRQSAYDAWNRARADIVREWAKASDPATLHPPIRPLWRQAAEHLRRWLPAEMSQDEQRTIIEALEAPRSLRDERALRKTFRPDAAEGEQTSRELARFVKERGFQPWRPPEPLPPIETEDVTLVVWMAVESIGECRTHEVVTTRTAEKYETDRA